MQQSYFTPIKTLQQSYQRKLFNSDSIHREGDWVCLNCQNLNYSFRKKCNRCKTQSREDNEAHSVYSYYYYPCNNRVEQPLVFTDEFTTAENPLPSSSLIVYDDNIHHHDEMMLFHQRHHLEEQFITTTPKNSEQLEENVKETVRENVNEFTDTVLQTPKKKKPEHQTKSKLDGLPSVSPLIKRYRQKQHHTTLQKQHNNNNLTTILGDSPRKNIDYNLPDVIVRDFDKLIHDFDNNSPVKDFGEDEEQCFGLMKDIQDSIARIII